MFSIPSQNVNCYLLLNMLFLNVTVLEAIISLLTPLDIISLSSTCKFFHELMLSDKVWVAACYTKFGIKLRASGGFAQKFYKKGKCWFL